jgi:ankyrin repeat protein
MSQEQLFEYAREGNLIKLGQMVDAEDLGATDADGMTALMHAAANNNYAVAGLFVGKDEANINAHDSAGKTALMHASAVGGSKIVKMLLKKGADPALTDNEGKTALDYADASGDAKTLKRLRELS